jgi:hypothetical protein
MDENMVEKCLPEFLRHDIDALVKGCENPEKYATIIDCLYNEVQGSINSALYDNQITKEEAEYLRGKYL